MDTKAARRNFYKNKVYLSEKFDEKYTTERFPEDVQFLLDEFIPKATLKQLSKLMEKKFHRIMKTYPELQKALKKVIRDKLQKIPQEMRKTQIQKLLSHLREQFENYEIIEKEKDIYQLEPKNKTQQKNYKIQANFESVKIFYPANLKFQITLDKTDKTVFQKGYYKVIHQNPENRFEVAFATSNEIELVKFEVKNGNFEREANNLLEKFNLFVQKMNSLENPEE